MTTSGTDQPHDASRRGGRVEVATTLTDMRLRTDDAAASTDGGRHAGVRSRLLGAGTLRRLALPSATAGAVGAAASADDPAQWIPVVKDATGVDAGLVLGAVALAVTLLRGRRRARSLA